MKVEQEIPCLITLAKLRGRIMFNVGDPLNIVVNRIPLYNPTPHSSWAGKGFLGLYRLPYMGGHQSWLIVSSSPEDISEEIHTEALGEDKPDITGATLTWVGPTNTQHWFEDDGLSTRKLITPIRGRLLDSIWQLVGGPYDRGQWLASFLRPGRLGAAVKLIKLPKYEMLQTWIRLSHT